MRPVDPAKVVSRKLALSPCGHPLQDEFRGQCLGCLITEWNAAVVELGGLLMEDCAACLELGPIDAPCRGHRYLVDP